MFLLFMPNLTAENWAVTLFSAFLLNLPKEKRVKTQSNYRSECNSKDNASCSPEKGSWPIEWSPSLNSINRSQIKVAAIDSFNIAVMDFTIGTLDSHRFPYCIATQVVEMLCRHGLPPLKHNIISPFYMGWLSFLSYADKTDFEVDR